MNIVGKITVQSAWLPEVTIDPNGPPSFLGPFLKPKVTVTIAGNPVTVTPYGEPGSSRWPYVVGGFVFLMVIIWAVKK